MPIIGNAQDAVTSEHPCNQCLRSFESEWYLKTHIEFHHDPNRYAQYCEICDIEFNNRWEEQKHKAKKHKQELKVSIPIVKKEEECERFKCPEYGCIETFTQHDQYVQHLHISHPNLEFDKTANQLYRCKVVIDHSSLKQCAATFNTRYALRQHTLTHAG